MPPTFPYHVEHGIALEQGWHGVVGVCVVELQDPSVHRIGPKVVRSEGGAHASHYRENNRCGPNEPAGEREVLSSSKPNRCERSDENRRGSESAKLAGAADEKSSSDRHEKSDEFEGFERSDITAHDSHILSRISDLVIGTTTPTRAQ